MATPGSCSADEVGAEFRRIRDIVRAKIEACFKKNPEDAPMLSKPQMRVLVQTRLMWQNIRKMELCIKKADEIGMIHWAEKHRNVAFLTVKQYKGGETGEGLKEIEEKPYAEVYVEGPMAPLLFDLTRFSVREVEEQLLIAVKDGYQKEEAADAFFLDNNTQNVRAATGSGKSLLQALEILGNMVAPSDSRCRGVVLVSSTASLHEMANVFTWGDCRDEEQKLAWIQNSLLRTVLGLSEKDVRWIAENTLVAKSKTVVTAELIRMHSITIMPFQKLPHLDEDAKTEVNRSPLKTVDEGDNGGQSIRPDSKWAPSYLDGKRAFTVLYSATSKKDSSVYIKRPMAVITHGDELEGQRVKRFNITSFKSVFRSADGSVLNKTLSGTQVIRNRDALKEIAKQWVSWFLAFRQSPGCRLPWQMIVFYEDDRGTDPVELKEIRGLFEAALETLASTGTLVRDVNGKAYCDVRKKHVAMGPQEGEDEDSAVEKLLSYEYDIIFTKKKLNRALNHPMLAVSGFLRSQNYTELVQGGGRVVRKARLSLSTIKSHPQYAEFKQVLEELDRKGKPQEALVLELMEYNNAPHWQTFIREEGAGGTLPLAQGSNIILRPTQFIDVSLDGSAPRHGESGPEAQSAETDITGLVGLLKNMELPANDEGREDTPLVPVTDFSKLKPEVRVERDFGGGFKLEVGWKKQRYEGIEGPIFRVNGMATLRLGASPPSLMTLFADEVRQTTYEYFYSKDQQRTELVQVYLLDTRKRPVAVSQVATVPPEPALGDPAAQAPGQSGDEARVTGPLEQANGASDEQGGRASERGEGARSQDDALAGLHAGDPGVQPTPGGLDSEKTGSRGEAASKAPEQTRRTRKRPRDEAGVDHPPKPPTPEKHPGPGNFNRSKRSRPVVDYSQLHEKGSRKKRRRGKGLGEDVGTPPSKRARDGEGTSDEGEGDSEDENGKNRGGHVGKKVGNMSAGKRQKGKGRTAKNKRARTSDDEDYDPDDDRDDGHSDSESDNELTEAEREKARRELEEADPDFQVASTPARARDGGTTRKPREGAKRSTLVAEAISIKRKVKQTKLDWNLAKKRLEEKNVTLKVVKGWKVEVQKGEEMVI